MESTGNVVLPMLPAGQNVSPLQQERASLMSTQSFRLSLLVLAAAFTVAFALVCIPPLVENPDIVAAFAGGFVNPYASGYALDIFFTWGILAVGFADYLLLRLKQEGAAGQRVHRCEAL